MTSKTVPYLFKWSTFTHINSFEIKLKNTMLFSKVWLSSAVALKKQGLERPAYAKTDHEYKITKQTTLKILENLLEIKTFTALDMLSRSEDLSKVTPILMKNNHALYLKNNINNETITRYPELLAVRDLEAKLLEIDKLSYKNNIVAPLLLLPLNTLKKFIQSEVQIVEERGKIATLARLLQVKEEDACEYLATKTFLRSLSTEKIENNVNTLTSFGITLEDICSDLWVLRYNNETITSRLKEAKTYKVDEVKTWMVRVQPEIFQNYIKRRSDNKSILGDNSLTEYLSERLECSSEVANYLILKQPALKSKSLIKLKELIDFLYAAGFKSHHICRVPKILVHSVETIRKRLKKLEDNNIKLDSLHMLTKSQKQFMQYYDILIKSKNKQKSK